MLGEGKSVDRSPGALVVLSSGDLVERFAGFKRSSSAKPRPNHGRRSTLVEAGTLVVVVVGAEEKSKDGVERGAEEGVTEGGTLKTKDGVERGAVEGVTGGGTLKSKDGVEGWAEEGA